MQDCVVVAKTDCTLGRGGGGSLSLAHSVSCSGIPPSFPSSLPSYPTFCPTAKKRKRKSASHNHHLFGQGLSFLCVFLVSPFGRCHCGRACAVVCAEVAAAWQKQVHRNLVDRKRRNSSRCRPRKRPVSPFPSHFVPVSVVKCPDDAHQRRHYSSLPFRDSKRVNVCACVLELTACTPGFPAFLC